MSTHLEKYTQAVARLKDHQEANKPVFDEHKELMLNVIDSENELRDAVAVTLQGEKNAYHEVVVREETQEVFEEDKVLGALGLTKQGAIDKGFIAVNKRPPRIIIRETRA